MGFACDWLDPEMLMNIDRGKARRRIETVAIRLPYDDSTKLELANGVGLNVNFSVPNTPVF